MAEQTRTVLTRDEMRAALQTMAEGVVSHAGEGPLALVGIRSRGIPLAQRLQAMLGKMGHGEIPLGTLDITLYRDDLTTLGPQPMVGQSELPFDLGAHTVALIDDVIFTGRTVRAALEALVAYGRPRAVRLAVLVDRGHREYPIQPDVVGLTLETSLSENVKVQLTEIDGRDIVEVHSL